MTTDRQHALATLMQATLGEDHVTELPDGTYQHTFTMGVDLPSKFDTTAAVMWAAAEAMAQWLSDSGWLAPSYYAHRVARARARSLRNQPLGIHGRRRNAHGRIGVRR